MEGWCLYHFIRKSNASSFYDNGGGYVHQPIDTVRKFHLHLSHSKMKNAATNTAYLYTLLAGIFEKKNDKRCNNVGSNRWMRKAV